VTKKLLLMAVILLAALAASCTNAGEITNGNANANPNSSEATASTRSGPDDSEITTSVDANGVRTETRVFRGNPRISKVVVTTDHGNRNVKAYSPSGEEREINKNEPEDVLEATGSAIADAAGFIANKSRDVAGAVKDKGETVGEKTVDTAKTVGEKSAEGARTVGEKTVQGSKTVANKTAEGAKKVGNAVKKVIP
jgi:hypothetical protein